MDLPFQVSGWLTSSVPGEHNFFSTTWPQISPVPGVCMVQISQFAGRILPPACN